MIKVVLVPHPLSFQDRQTVLSETIESIVKDRGTILFITSDSEGYTIIYKTGKNILYD